MAAITSSNVTITESWDAGTKSGKFRGLAQRVVVALSSQGATAADLPASAFGLSVITEAYSGTLDASGTYTARTLGISPTGSYVFPGNVSTGAPVDVTGNLYMTIVGYPALS